ncbi:hypothetical protein SME10J_41380 [Serratia marcescens]|nr:hypothetical protein SME10J_41380 [Serratia marcescens]
MMPLLDCFMPMFVCVLRTIQHQEESVEVSRQKLLSALMQAQDRARLQGYVPKDIEDASFAVVVWADEAILCAEKEALHLWRLASLQQERYDSALGGHTFFERLATLSSDNYPVRLVYLFCLLCGFRGRYDNNDNLLLDNIIQQQLDNLSDEHKSYLSDDYPYLLPGLKDVKPDVLNGKNWRIKLFLVILSLAPLYLLVVCWLLNMSV